ncbi:MAG TPA: AlkA N-terminal domain-containing protein [Nocardioidaceae bacterium]|nr:AlkA N-terminal domain-containing protein [Nocardioidaceae bacterium]
MDIADTEACYRAVKSRDARFDGVFYTGVTSTGIYCRPSCPAITPQKKNVTFHRTAAAAQAAGFRACKRCLPDATPGSPEWDVAADTAGRAMRLIADGVVERDGVEGLSSRVGYSSRQLNRILTSELGAGPLALARSRRAQTARTLVETSDMSFADVAFAAGFASIRQFNDTIREVYAATPSELRGRRRGAGSPVGVLDLRLAVRPPFAAADLFSFLRMRAAPGVEQADESSYSRTLRLPHGSGRVRLTAPAGTPASGRRAASFVGCRLEVADLRDVGAAVERCRRLVDADCDPVAVDEALGSDVRLARLVRARPGLRVPGHVDGDEIAVRAVIGQQISVAGARTVAGRLAEEYGERLPESTTYDGLTHLFPTAAVLAEVDPARLPMPRARGRAVNALCAALASGDIALDRGADRADVRRRVLALPGAGPWTADYIALRALGDPDVFLPTDLGAKHGLSALRLDPEHAATTAEAWRPWRSYALMHLWTAAVPAPAGVASQPKEN